MKDYDFNIIEVLQTSETGTNGCYWENVKVDHLHDSNGRCYFQGTMGSGANLTTRISYFDKSKNIVDEKATFASWYLEELKKRRGEIDEEKEQESTDSDTDSSSCSCGGLFHTLTQVLFTIIPILLVWWIVKLFIKTGWYCIKAIGYIISWPVRLLCCCCCSTKFLPDATSLPEYWFNMK